MKNLIILVFGIFILGCQPKEISTPPVNEKLLKEYTDRLYIQDSLLNVFQIKLDQCRLTPVSGQTLELKACLLTNDSLKTALGLANSKIEKVKYYVNICLKNPVQKKYFFGWISQRAIK